MSASMVLAWEELSESSDPSLWTSEIKIWAAVNGHSQNPLGLCSFLPSYLKYTTIIFPGAHVSVNKWFLVLASNSTHCKHIQNLIKLYVATHVHSHPSLSKRDSSQPGLPQSSRSVTLPLGEASTSRSAALLWGLSVSLRVPSTAARQGLCRKTGHSLKKMSKLVDSD